MFKRFSLKHIAMILVIALIGVAGIISCSNPTEAEESFIVDASELPENNPTTNNGKPAPESTYPNSPRNWHDATYREVYVPFAGVYYDNEKGERQWNRAIVSYMDSNTLTQLWKDQMDAKGKGDNYDFFLRNKRNTKSESNFKIGNDYYFFDADFNIRHKKWPEVILKELVGGVMTIYNHTDAYANGKWTIAVGGLYKTVYNMPKYEYLSPVDNDEGVYLFMNGREVGDLEVMIMNVGASQINFTLFGCDLSYYSGNDNYDIRLKTKREEWYSELRPPESVLKVSTYKELRGTDKAIWYYFSSGQAEIARYR